MTRTQRNLQATFFVLVAALSVFAAGLYLYTHRPIDRIPSGLDSVDNITFYALGDQGSGGVKQWEVSRAMESLAEKENDLDFVVLMGDNFYTKDELTLESPEWLSKFEHVYAGKFLNAIPFYAVLGNHDHGHSDHDGSDESEGKKVLTQHPEVQIEYSRKHMGSNRWRMPDWYYSEDFGKVQNRPLLRMVFLDTNLKHDDLLKEADFIRKQFAESPDSPIWKIVVGHHPARTYGKHFGKVEEIAATLLPAMQDAHVDLYLAGHDHNQQVILRDKEPFQFINGGGGAGTYDIKRQSPDLVFSRSGHGFIGVRLDKDALIANIYDATAKTVASYKIERNCPQGKASCLQRIPD